MQLYNQTSCVQVHELRQSHCGDNRDATLFSWLHIYYAHLASMRSEQSLRLSVVDHSLMTTYIYIYIYINIYIYIYIKYIYIYVLYNVYMNKKPVCVCVAQWQLNKKHKVCRTNFRMLLILSHVCGWWNSQRLQFIYYLKYCYNST